MRKAFLKLFTNENSGIFETFLVFVKKLVKYLFGKLVLFIELTDSNKFFIKVDENGFI
jgi:hypothetical protein